MINLAPIGLTMLVLLGADQSGGTLIGERAVGTRRICVYEDLLRGRRAPPLTMQVGAAEPCPFRYRRPRPARAPEIPPMATLVGRVRENGQTVCQYGYLGVRYGRPIQGGRSCPYTPVFND